MSARRSLSFESVAEAPVEATRLLEGGYESRGNWDLSQVCEHLADWMEFPLDGFPPVPPWFKPVLLAVRHTLGPRLLKRTLATGAMPPGSPTAARTVHEPAGDPASDAAAVERLRQVTERFLAHEGEYQISPFFGQMTRDQCRRLQAIHTAHHLGFLEPK